jgi:spermidine synthase
VALGIAILLFAAPGATRRFATGWSAAGVIVLVAVGVFAPIAPDRTASGVYRLGSARLDSSWKIVHNRDGKTATVTVLDTGDVISIRTNGKTDASIAIDRAKPTDDEYTMVMTGLLPLAYRPDIQRAAVIGFGSGLTTATLLGSPNLTRLDTIEIEPEIVAGAKLFGPLVAPAYDDPRSHIVIDDAKSYFARSGVRYDLIISEPSNPWVSGVASLFTVEFYAQVKRQLASRGLFVQWLQMYEFSDELMATILRALDGAFADYAIYASNRGDLIIVASMDPLPKVPDAAFTRWPGMQRIFERMGFSTVDEIEARRVVGRSTVQAMLDRLGRGTNSDYYPLVDLGAPRSRFLRDTSDALVNVSIAAIPAVEMLEGRDASATPVDLLPSWPPGAKRTLIVIAHAAAGWLGAGTPPADPETPLPADIGVLRAAIWHCADVPPDKDIVATIVNVAEYVNPYVPPAVANRLWTQVRNAPCTRKLKVEDRQWIALAEAVGARDASRMATLGTDLVKNYTVGSDLARAYALAAAATGLLVQGKRAETRALLDAYLEKLPRDQQHRSEFVLLLGNLETELTSRK